MPKQTNSLHMPPVMHREDGGLRRVGMELELIGLSIDTLSQIVADYLHARVEKSSVYEHLIHGDDRGDWHVELDYAYLRQKGRDSHEPDSLVEEIESVAEDLLRAGAEQVVPYEIVSPPLPLDQLADMEPLIKRLRRAGAQGTRAGIAYAFGMQFNPELPDTRAETILRYLKAFFCLFDWLKLRAEVDWTRRLTLFAKPFPRPYVRKVVDPDYWPSLDTLIDDYLEANPTRNRALDLLPMFKHLDAARLKTVVDDPRVKARPTLHYRLPNCEVDEPAWGIYHAWDDWLQVEHLVAEPPRLQQLCTRYHRHLQHRIRGLFRPWKKQVRSWLIPAGDL